MNRWPQINATFWLFYFLLSISFMGVFWGFAVITPLYLAGRVYAPSKRLADRVMRGGVAFMLRYQPWLKAELEVSEHPGPILSVSNHRSHLDVFLLLAQVAGIRIVAKKSLYRVPFLGFMMRMMEHIPVSSHDPQSLLDAMEELRQRLRSGEVVHVFPELTRCPPGHQGTLSFSVLPFRIAHQEGLMVRPIAIKKTDQVWPKGFSRLNSGQEIATVGLPLVDSRKFSSAVELRNAVQNQIAAALL